MIDAVCDSHGPAKRQNMSNVTLQEAQSQANNEFPTFPRCLDQLFGAHVIAHSLKFGRQTSRIQAGFRTATWMCVFSLSTDR